jgi:hypothetical protein
MRRTSLLAGARVFAATVALIVAGFHGPAAAQYFGQNKVQYDRFEFRVLETEHFDIHYYPSEAEAARQVALMAERWHARLSRTLNHQLTGRQAVVLYASHPEFEQTNVIEGMIDESTGGVTEGLRRRVVLPLAATMAETDHVLGHELVHAFQYDILGIRASAVPLWFIEGMAEYLSVGPRSVQTAMWLRDAAIEGRLPGLENLDDPRYFPYRFGHAFWAYIGGRFGDEQVATILHRMGLAARGAPGVSPIAIIESATEMKAEDLSKEWNASIYATYGIPPREQPEEGEKRESPPPPGQIVIGQRTGHSSLNVGPSLSPDGSKIAFLSGRGRLSIDVYVADAATGKVIRSLTKTAVDTHFQSLQFIASAGAWSPDSQRLAVATVREGRPRIAVFNVDTGELVEEIGFDHAGEILQPAWSLDGQSLAFSAQVGGFSDLYVYSFGTKQFRRLTEDPFADLQPVWSPDGQALVFVTDRFSSDAASLQYGQNALARLDLATGRMVRIETELRGSVYNPQWEQGGRTLLVLSDATGRPEVYRLDLATGRAVVVTNEPTGVSGITPLSPALSVARSTGRTAIAVFHDGGYEIRFIEPSQAASASAGDPSGRDYALLPPVDRPAGTIAQSLAEPGAGLPAATTFPTRNYSPKLSLLHVGNAVGLSTGGAYGTYAAGGVALLFSDLLGDHIVSTTLEVNGGVRDVGGQLAYFNRTHRWNWGVFGQRLPLVNGAVQAGYTTINNQFVYVEQVLLDRQTYSDVGMSVAYPLSRASRVEFSLAAEHIGFSREIETSVFDPFTLQFLGVQREDQPASPSLTLGRSAAALVRDTTSFGPTSPILGQRFRFEVAPTWGQLRMTGLTADYRHYVMPVQPITFATRLMHYGRYGSGGEDSRMLPLFLGYYGLVRGYDPGSFEASECTPTPDGSCPEFDRLVGSRIAVVNAEVRAPAVGLFKGRLSYGPIPLELFGFFDAGVAWTRDTRPSFAGGDRDWVSSTGFGARVNAFGYLIAEVNLARPLNRDRGWLFVFNLRPGF